MQPVIRVEIHTDEDCILFQSREHTQGFQRDIINCIALAFEKFYTQNPHRYEMITTDNGGMILEVR